jgi:hypothetical protein
MVIVFILMMRKRPFGGKPPVDDNKYWLSSAWISKVGKTLTGVGKGDK